MSICKPCAVAADLISLYREDERLQKAHFSGLDEKATVNAAQVIAKVASGLHGLCYNCDCQHILDWEGKTTYQPKHAKTLVEQDYEKLAGEGLKHND